MVQKGVILTIIIITIMAILIIIVKGHCILSIFWFHFYCFVDSVVFFTSSGKSLQWSHSLLAEYLQCKVRLIYCMVLSYCIWRGFEVIVMFGGYSDSLVFLLTHSLYTTAEPSRNRSLTNFLKSTVM